MHGSTVTRPEEDRPREVPVRTHEVDLKTPLRETGSVVAAVEQALAGKPERHFLQIGTASGSGGLSALSQVGG